MKTNEFLYTALQDKVLERFCANAAVEAIEEKIAHLAKNFIYEKYKDKVLVNDNLEFKLHRVHATIDGWVNALNLPKIEVNLYYFCSSNLPKDKMQKIESAKVNLEIRKFLPHSNYKIPLWKSLRYHLDIEEVLLGKSQLIIE